MEYSLINLLKHSASTPNLQKKIAKAVVRYSYNDDERIGAAKILNESIEIDLLQLESLINPDKFEFEDVEIGKVVV